MGNKGSSSLAHREDLEMPPEETDIKTPSSLPPVLVCANDGAGLTVHHPDTLEELATVCCCLRFWLLREKDPELAASSVSHFSRTTKSAHRLPGFQSDIVQVGSDSKSARFAISCGFGGFRHTGGRSVSSNDAKWIHIVDILIEDGQVAAEAAAAGGIGDGLADPESSCGVLLKSRLVGTCRGHVRAVWKLAPIEHLPQSLNPTRCIASASSDETVRLWDTETLQQVAYIDHPMRAYCVGSASWLNLFFVAGERRPSNGAYMACYDLSSTLAVRQFQGSAGSTVAMHVCDESRFVITGQSGQMGIVRLWDARVRGSVSFVENRPLRKHPHGAVAALHYAADRSLLAVLFGGGMVRLHDVRMWKTQTEGLATFRAHPVSSSMYGGITRLDYDRFASCAGAGYGVVAEQGDSGGKAVWKTNGTVLARHQRPGIALCATSRLSGLFEQALCLVLDEGAPERMRFLLQYVTERRDSLLARILIQASKKVDNVVLRVSACLLQE